MSNSGGKAAFQAERTPGTDATGSGLVASIGLGNGSGCSALFRVAVPERLLCSVVCSVWPGGTVRLPGDRSGTAGPLFRSARRTAPERPGFRFLVPLPSASFRPARPT
jgi:hypothetical protein